MGYTQNYHMTQQVYTLTPGGYPEELKIRAQTLTHMPKFIAALFTRARRQK